MGSDRTFPIKAPTRQMLYPLSYRGKFKALHVSTSKIYVNRVQSSSFKLVVSNSSLKAEL